MPSINDQNTIVYGMIDLYLNVVFSALMGVNIVDDALELIGLSRLVRFLLSYSFKPKSKRRKYLLKDQKGRKYGLVDLAQHFDLVMEVCLTRIFLPD